MSLEKASGVELRELLAAVAGPRQWSDTRESWLSRAARQAGITFRQAKACFYGERTDPSHPTARKLRDAAARSGATEAGALAEKFELVARSLRAADADFHRADIVTLVDAARALRCLGVPRTDRVELKNED